MPPKQRIVLCVDDDPDDQMLMLETIKEIAPDVRVATALNGEEGLKFLERSKGEGQKLPCLIIMDINMPILDGKEAIVRIKKDKAYDGIPIALFTTSSSSIDKTFGEKYGIHFLTKPLNVLDFRQKVSFMLGLAADC